MVTLCEFHHGLPTGQAMRKHMKGDKYFGKYLHGDLSGVALHHKPGSNLTYRGLKK